MSAIIQASPLEKLSQEPMPEGKKGCEGNGQRKTSRECGCRRLCQGKPWPARVRRDYLAVLTGVFSHGLGTYRDLGGGFGICVAICAKSVS
jgi:hypothetical protein